MTKKTNVEVLLAMDGKYRSTTSVDVHTLSKKERVQLFLKTFGVWIGVAICCAFIPFLHFILVPLALILGLVFSFNTVSRTRQIVSAGVIVCPKCAKDLPIDSKAFEWPKRLNCAGCEQLIFVQIDN